MLTQLAWFAGIALLVFGIEPLYREPLFDYSLDLIKEIQDTWLHEAREAFGVISDIGHTLQSNYIYIACVFLPFSTSFYSLFVIQTTYCLMNFLKNFYSDPRPFFTTEGSDIEVIGSCYTQFGNPSGHSSQISVLFLLVHLHIWGSFVGNWKSSLYMGLVTAPLIGLFTFARIVMGVHSLNQILFGTLIGLAVTL
jgi:membrane-associated phospholipid phosphatase